MHYEYNVSVIIQVWGEDENVRSNKILYECTGV